MCCPQTQCFDSGNLNNVILSWVPTGSHQEQPCLALCCPHGQALVIDEQSGEEVCNEQKPRREEQVVGYNQKETLNDDCDGISDDGCGDDDAPDRQ